MDIFFICEWSRRGRARFDMRCSIIRMLVCCGFVFWNASSLISWCAYSQSGVRQYCATHFRIWLTSFCNETLAMANRKCLIMQCGCHAPCTYRYVKLYIENCWKCALRIFFPFTFFVFDEIWKCAFCPLSAAFTNAVFAKTYISNVLNVVYLLPTQTWIHMHHVEEGNSCWPDGCI